MSDYERPQKEDEVDRSLDEEDALEKLAMRIEKIGKRVIKVGKRVGRNILTACSAKKESWKKKEKWTNS